jgi:photosystem II stability/assembly factor-like uncharacterized protein
VKKNIFVVLGLLTVVWRVAAFSYASPESTQPVGLQWLGHVPEDNLYSTRAMRIYGNRGVIVKENSVLISNDGGESWSELRRMVSPSDISSAWLTPSLHMLRLSDNLLFVSDTPDGKTRNISLDKSSVTYLAAAATEALQQIFVVGGRSVIITAQKLETVPQFATDPTTASPRMIVPIISVSNDHGQTWQRTDLDRAVGDLDSVAVADKNVIAWGPYAVYASTNAGKSWKLMTRDIPDLEEEAYPVSAAIIADHAYISLKNGRLLGGEIAGKSLKPIATLSNAIGQLTFTSPCVGFGILSSTTSDGDVLMETRRGGLAWTPVLRTRKLLALTSDGSEVYGITNDRVFRFDSGETRVSKSCAAHND